MAQKNSQPLEVLILDGESGTGMPGHIVISEDLHSLESGSVDIGFNNISFEALEKAFKENGNSLDSLKIDDPNRISTIIDISMPTKDGWATQWGVHLDGSIKSAAGDYEEVDPNSSFGQKIKGTGIKILQEYIENLGPNPKADVISALVKQKHAALKNL